MVEAAAQGLGVALLPQFLASPDLAGGRLISLFDGGVPGAGSHCLVWPKTGAWYPPLQAFRGWLAGEGASDQLWHIQCLQGRGIAVFDGGHNRADQKITRATNIFASYDDAGAMSLHHGPARLTIFCRQS